MPGDNAQLGFVPTAGDGGRRLDHCQARQLFAKVGIHQSSGNQLPALK
jgi:hypothetical protein